LESNASALGVTKLLAIKAKAFDSIISDHLCFSHVGWATKRRCPPYNS